MRDITIKCADASAGASLAAPAGGTGPGLLIIQQIFGVTYDKGAAEQADARALACFKANLR